MKPYYKEDNIRRIKMEIVFGALSPKLSEQLADTNIRTMMTILKTFVKFLIF